MSEFSDRLFIQAMGLVPKKRLSRAVRSLAKVRSRVAVDRFAARYGVSIEEAEKPIAEYASVLDLFTRRLKPGLRPLDPDPKALLCPVDGRLYSEGAIEQGLLFQAKGRTFTLAALLGSPERASVFERGSYITLYLSPRDYHRVHCPIDAEITGYTYMPGELYPVNPAAVANVDGLFARNERLITHLSSPDFGQLDLVMVGATCVGHIKVSYDATLSTNLGEHRVRHEDYAPTRPIGRGEELGVFEMGSTVILVAEPRVRLEPLAPDSPVRLGMRLGARS
jgi:phosphatidylserine decarboxylase